MLIVILGDLFISFLVDKDSDLQDAMLYVASAVSKLSSIDPLASCAPK